MKKALKWIALALTALSMSVMLTACAPSSIEKGKSKMVEAGYDVGDTFLDGLVDGCLGGFYASEGLLSEDKMTAYLFESKDAAKAYFEKLGNDKAVLKGKWVLVGSEDAIEDFLEFGL